MNDRIKELAEEAGMIIIDDEFSSYGRYTERFAELIINTCAYVAHNTQYKHSHAHSVGDCATAIKEYFGIGMSTEDKKNLIKELLGVKNNDELA